MLLNTHLVILLWRNTSKPWNTKDTCNTGDDESQSLGLISGTWKDKTFVYVRILKVLKVCMCTLRVMCGLREILHVSVKDFGVLSLCVCARREKSAIPDTLSQSQCYASSKNSSSLATSEPPTHPSQHTAWLQSIFVLGGDNSNLQLRFPTDFLNVAFTLSFGKRAEFFFLFCFVVSSTWWLFKLIPQKRIVEDGRKHFDQSSGQCGVQLCGNTHAVIKKTLLTGFEACLLKCSEAIQHADMLLGLCVRACECRCMCVCVCAGSMRECQKAEEKKKPRPNTVATAAKSPD